MNYPTKNQKSFKEENIRNNIKEVEEMSNGYRKSSRRRRSSSSRISTRRRRRTNRTPSSSRRRGRGFWDNFFE